jgi:acyl carrier protein
VQRAISWALRLSAAELQPTTKVIHDLGAESIDFLDITYELEEKLKVEVDFRSLFEAKRGQTDDPDVTIQELVEYLQEQLQAATAASQAES